VSGRGTPRGGRKGPKPLGEGVDRLLRDLGAPSISAIDRLLEAWPEAVGPVLAASTRPLAVRDGRLVVEADDPTVASTVRWSKSALVAALDRLVEPGVVAEVEVRVARRGGSGRAPGAADGRR
jgi:hypothetical protein